MEHFTLHPTLAADSFYVGDLPLCRLLLTNNALFPWVILVPRLAEAVELTSLNDADYTTAMQEIRLVAKALELHCTPYKLNIGALGNQVRQLHIHMIARFERDAAWPNPVWGNAREPYTADDAEKRIAALRKLLPEIVYHSNL